MCVFFFFFFKQKTAYEIMPSLVGSEMCIRDRTMMVQTALNLLGSTQVAAFTAANKIEQIVTQAYVAMGTTMATYCAQNIGAGKIKRIRQGFKSITIMGSIYSVVVAAIIMTVGKYMTYLFLSGDLTEIMHSVDIYLKCVGTFSVSYTHLTLPTINSV